MFWKRRSIHLSDEDLSAYLDGELSAARLTEASSHLEACDECSVSLEELRLTADLMSRLPEVEAPRSFVLSPAMAGVQPKPAAPRKPSFVFVPAAALTLLLALFAVDLTSTTNSSRDDSGAGQAMVAEDAKSSGGLANESNAERSTLNQPASAPEPLISTPSSVAPVAPSTGVQGTPGGPIPPPSTGGAILPTPADGSAANPPTAAGVAPPATGPGPSPTPTTFFSPPTPPNTSGPITSQAAGAADSAADGDLRDGGDLADSGGSDGTDWLRIAQIVVAATFLVSLAYFFVPGLLKKGS